MKRRDFIALLGGAAAWPLAARAQQGDRMRRVGVLTGGTSDDPETKSLLAVFQRTLQERGWIEGRTIQFEYRFAGDDADLRQIYAVELAAKAPDVEGEHPKIDPHFVTGRDVFRGGRLVGGRGDYRRRGRPLFRGTPENFCSL